MKSIIRTSFSAITLLILTACNLFGPPTQAVLGTSVVRLTVQTQNNVNTYSRAGEIITFQYVVTNTGSAQLAGPVIITDPPRQAVCPNVNTVGNQDAYLDLNETITCAATYTITDADINTGSITNVATATVGGVISNQAGVTLTRGTGTAQPSTILRLAKTASSQTYGQLGQTITYTYVLTNGGTTALGPAQFTISDTKLGAPFNCGLPNTTIAAGQTLSCTANYLITAGDLTSPTLTNTATASGGGQTSAPVSITIANLTITQTPTGPTLTPVPPSNLTPGSTITHRVAVGEWLIQITRCYGATLSEVRDANRQIPNLNMILKDQFVTVPRIGSAGTIYGPDSCVVFYTVQSGDTWNSIADRNNACLAVLQRANPAGLVVGSSIKVPRNSRALYCPGTTPGTSVPPGPVTTVPPTTQRITIDPGQTTATRIGVINPNETIRFVLNASQGQVLSVKLTAPANEVALGVNSPTGIALKPLDTSPTWSAAVTTSGDHLITLVAVLGNTSKSYTLEVSLTAPAATPTFTPTATPTNTPG